MRRGRPSSCAPALTQRFCSRDALFCSDGRCVRWQVSQQDDDWWTGYRLEDPGKVGIFPKNFVKIDKKKNKGKKGK